MLAPTMSCMDVMYQSAYASYFPYQRPSAASPVDSFKKFGSSVKHHDHSLVEAHHSSSYSSHSASSLSSLPGSSSSLHGGGHTSSSSLHSAGHTSHLHGGGHTPSSPPALSAPTSATVAKIEEHVHSPLGDSSGMSQQRQQHHGGGDHHPTIKQDTSSDHGGDAGVSGGAAPTPHNAQYLSTNCVLFTYYAGEVASQVDEHFSRALSQGGSSSGSPASSYPGAADGGAASQTSKSPSWKAGSSPMSQRNFPASFWNSSYQQVATSSLSHPDSLGSLHASSEYMTSPLHSMSSLGGDPWRYSLTSQTHSTPYAAHHNVHDMAYVATMAGTSRFQPHYGSLLGSGRLGSVAGQCDLGKHSMEGHWGSRYHAESLGAPSMAGHPDTTHHLHSAITAGKWY